MTEVEVPERIAAWARQAKHVCVLTGAGMSAESGVPTFRDVATGLWSQYSQADLASVEALNEHPGTVWAWYSWRATTIRNVDPNPGHIALAQWQQRTKLDIVTQNVDELHERAGADVLAHVHGSIFDVRCMNCGLLSEEDYPRLLEPVEYIDPPACLRCGGSLRPGVVLFGETLPEGALEAGAQAAQEADLVLVVGTSGMVYPAALLPEMAAAAGVPVVEINPQPTPASKVCSATWRTTAAIALPALVSSLTGVE